MAASELIWVHALEARFEAKILSLGSACLLRVNRFFTSHLQLCTTRFRKVA